MSNAHYRKWQVDSNSDTRGVERAAKADVKAAKAELKAEERKAEKLQVYKEVIKKAKAIGALKERKRAASAIAVSDDEEEGFDWDRLCPTDPTCPSQETHSLPIAFAVIFGVGR